MKKPASIFLFFLYSVMSPAQVKIIAHRGASYLAPENTVVSARLAWELGADAVEVDIYLSKDNEIFCLHDANTKRTTGEDFNIRETDSDIIRNLDAGLFKDEKYKGERIPFLREVIRTIPAGKELVIELKCGIEVLPYLEEEIGNSGKNKQFSFICFDFTTISEIKNKFPGYPCYWLCSNQALLEKNLDLVPAAGLEGVSLSYNLIGKELADKVKNLDLELYTWTVDNPEEAKRLTLLGIKGITTNRPGWLREQIK